MKKYFLAAGLILVIFVNSILSLFSFCSMTTTGENQAVSASGVKKAETKVEVQSSGFTVEQENIIRRLTLENEPGAIKHLYLISAYSGQVLIYSTVRGKITSSGKRLTPLTVAAVDGEYIGGKHQGIETNLNGIIKNTGEVLQDDGTYGHSIDYIYWWDVQGRYHQHYISGGQILHVSDQPLAVKNIVINMNME